MIFHTDLTCIVIILMENVKNISDFHKFMTVFDQIFYKLFFHWIKLFIHAV